MKKIYLDESQKKIVLNILSKHFPNQKYFVFGSRATGINLKPFSDLDIAVQSSTKLTDSNLAIALEDFSSSDLPFKVDLVDLSSISAEFLANIKTDLIQI
jgi:predicted nucleotidyltransferase